MVAFKIPRVKILAPYIYLEGANIQLSLKNI